jgi:rhodanese-related sulfurtransferase
MRKIALLAVLALAACGRDEARRPAEGGAEVADRVGAVTVAELAALLADGAAAPIDANNRATRERQGTIPGAVLLSGYRDYPITELPADRDTKLVFYCANEQCGASHEAAARAVRAGFTDVAVLTAGIAGWRGEGQRTQEL